MVGSIGCSFGRGYSVIPAWVEPDLAVAAQISNKLSWALAYFAVLMIYVPMAAGASVQTRIVPSLRNSPTAPGSRALWTLLPKSQRQRRAAAWASTSNESRK